MTRAERAHRDERIRETFAALGGRDITPSTLRVRLAEDGLAVSVAVICRALEAKDATGLPFALRLPRGQRW